MSPIAILARELQQLEDIRPEMPRGLEADHPEFIRWHAEFSAHVDRKLLLLARLNVAMCPIETNVRQERPIPAIPSAQLARLRR